MVKKTTKGPITITFQTLSSLLGKSVDDPEVTAAFATAGKVMIKPEFVIAKEAGFDYSLGKPTGGKRKVLTSLFLYPEGQDDHRAFADLPKGFAFGTRPDLLSNLAEPRTTWKIGPGKVPVTTVDASWDLWVVGDYEIIATYSKGLVRHINVRLPNS